MKVYGKIDWAISAGRIPSQSCGKEPEMISHDKVAVLNTSDAEAVVLLSVFYEDEPPATYEVKVPAKRLKKIRFNDLIDPAAIRMERNFSCYIRSDVPVVVQYSRLNTGDRENAEMTTMGFPVDN